jgi:uroporphyrinogen-III synthase
MDLAGATLAVQLDGGDSLATELEHLAGCEVVPVEIYRWLLPDDLEPAHRLIAAATDGRLDAITFTASPALRHLHHIAERRGAGPALAATAANGTAAVCVGPVCAATARDHGWRTIVEPSRARLVAMIDELVVHRRSVPGDAEAVAPPRWP